MSWLTGSLPSSTKPMYSCISCSLLLSPLSACSFPATSVASVLTVASLTSRKRCSTPATCGWQGHSTLDRVFSFDLIG